MGTPGRLSTKEIEISELTRQTLQAQDSLTRAKAALDSLRDKKDHTTAEIQLKIDKDPRLNNYLGQIDEIDLKLAKSGASAEDAARLQKRKSALEAKAKQRRDDLAALLLQAKTESLQNTIDTAGQTLADLKPRLNQAKQELGELTYQMSQYLSAKDEERATQKQLDTINRMLTQLSMLQQMSSFIQESDLHELDRKILGLPTGR